MTYLRHFIFCIATVLNFAIIQPVLSSSVSAVKSSIVHNEKQGLLKDLLNRAPLYKKGGVPQATVGIIPYRFKNGITEVFLGQEKDLTWSDFGGKYEIADTNILSALQREFSEETGGSFVSKESADRPSSILLYINKPDEREVFYLFVQFDDIGFKENDEKKQARWFDLMTLNTQTAFPLRKFFKSDLIESEHFKSIQDLLNAQK